MSAVPKKYKYMVYPGQIKSVRDGDIHHISFMQLVELYGVDERECVDASQFRNLVGFRGAGLIKLRPKKHAHQYKLPTSQQPVSR